MYKSKNLLPSHGKIKINVAFKTKEGSNYVETGYAQSVNVKNHIKQMIEEAVLNALYKLNHRRGERMFNKKDYNEDLSQYIQNFKILSYVFFYYEDRRYSYTREHHEGQYVYVIRRDGEIFHKEKTNRLNQKRLNDIADTML